MRGLLVAAALVGGAASAQAGASSPQFCDRPAALTPRQQDRLLRFAVEIQQVLEDSGREVAVVSRSGLDLSRFGLRYSHAGVSLKASADGPWSVRQLYYACDEGRPRLFDQGLSGFVFGTDDPSLGHVSLVLLPQEAGDRLARAALDKPRALRLLAARYSANAYPYSLRYQNCNQWVVELLATAWGELPDGDDLRARSQRWLVDRAYLPEPVDVGSHALMFAGVFVPWIHLDDQPEDDRFALKLRISLPRSIERFVHEQLPQAERVELCHDERRIVVHRGWTPMGPGCEPGPGDRTVAID